MPEHKDTKVGAATEAQCIKLTNALNNKWDTFPLRVPEGTLIRVLRNAEGCVTQGVPEGTPAWVDYRTETIYLDVDAIWGANAGASLARINDHFAGISSRRTPKEWDTLCGFLNHEISHAFNSRWAEGEKFEGGLGGSVMMMEEIHVEKKAADKGGLVAIDKLRQSFGWLVSKLSEEENLPANPAGIAKLWALVVGRHLAGIVHYEEVEDIDIIARSSLGDDLVDTAVEILTEAASTTHLPKRMALAKEWDELFPPPPEMMIIQMGCSGHAPEDESDEGDEKSEGQGAKEGNEEGDSKGAGKPDDEKGDDGDEEDGRTTSQGVINADDAETVSMIRGALRDKKKMVSDRAFVDVGGLKLADPRIEAAAAHKRGKSGNGWTTVPPTDDDRKNSRRLARMLETLALPTVTKVPTASVLPPGRLRGRAAVQKAAEKSQRRMPVAKPFEMTKRTRTTTKPVIVGCMTDTSGSMSWATEFIGHFAWIVATAGKAIGARTAAVTYGNTVYINTRPTEAPREVHIRNAWDSTEAFDRGAATIDGLLKIRETPNASKVLFIVSDGYYVGENEVEKCCLWTEEFTKAGTTIVWVGAESEYTHYKARVKKPGAMRSIGVDYHHPDLNKLFNEMSAVIREAAAATR